MTSEKSGQSEKTHDRRALSRREALEKGVKNAAYLAPVAALLLTKQAKAGVPLSPPGSGAVTPSDVRLKRNIVPLTTLRSGIKLYCFRYWWDVTDHVGVMAQDLLDDGARGDAVFLMPNGFYAVDYGRLGLALTTVDELVRVPGPTRAA